MRVFLDLKVPPDFESVTPFPCEVPKSLSVRFVVNTVYTVTKPQGVKNFQSSSPGSPLVRWGLKSSVPIATLEGCCG